MGVGGWGKIKIKNHLSPAEAEVWTELGNIFSLNVGSSASLAGLVTLVELNRFDIIFLQEVRSSKAQIENLLRGFTAFTNIDSENPSRPGTAVAWKQDIPVSDAFNLVLCRLQVITVGCLKLFNVYAPSGSDKRQESAIFFGEQVFEALQLDSTFSFLLW